MVCYYKGTIIKGCSRYSPSLIEKEHDIWDEYDHRNHEVGIMGSGESDARLMRDKVVIKPKKLDRREEARQRLSDHYIETISGCEFGDHWSCSCGESGLDDSKDHLLDILFPR